MPLPRPPRRRRTWADIDIVDNAPGVGTIGYDLLNPYKTAAGIIINLPGITIGPIKLKISLIINVGAVAANNGVRYGVSVVDVTDATGANVNSPLTAPYDVPWLWLEHKYVSEQEVMGGSAVNPRIYGEINTKTMRKLPNQNSTLCLAFTPTGNSTIQAVAISGRILQILP